MLCSNQKIASTINPGRLPKAKDTLLDLIGGLHSPPAELSPRLASEEQNLLQIGILLLELPSQTTMGKSAADLELERETLRVLVSATPALGALRGRYEKYCDVTVEGSNLEAIREALKIGAITLNILI